MRKITVDSSTGFISSAAARSGPPRGDETYVFTTLDPTTGSVGEVEVVLHSPALLKWLQTHGITLTRVHFPREKNLPIGWDPQGGGGTLKATGWDGVRGDGSFEDTKRWIAEQNLRDVSGKALELHRNASAETTPVAKRADNTWHIHCDDRAARKYGRVLELGYKPTKSTPSGRSWQVKSPITVQDASDSRTETLVLASRSNRQPPTLKVSSRVELGFITYVIGIPRKHVNQVVTVRGARYRVVEPINALFGSDAHKGRAEPLLVRLPHTALSRPDKKNPNKREPNLIRGDMLFFLGQYPLARAAMAAYVAAGLPFDGFIWNGE